MEYSRPKVTIDLEEYTELLKKKDFISIDNEDNMSLCIIMGTLHKMNIDRNQISYLLELLTKKGIRLSIDTNPTYEFPKVTTEKIVR